MLLNSYYYNVNYFVRSLMCLVYNRKIIHLFIYYSTCFRNHLANGVCDNSKSCDTCGEWFIGTVIDHVCNISYCSYCSW